MKARLVAAAAGVLLVTACGGSVAPLGSTRPTVTASPAPSATPTDTSSPAATATPTSAPSTPTAPPARPPLLVINDVGAGVPGTAQVRVARLDATDVGVLHGQFEGVVAGKAVALNGVALTAMAYDGTTTHVGTLVSAPSTLAGSVVLSPDLSQWLYTTASASAPLTAQIHLGSAGGDRIVATVPSPNGNGIFAPYAWTSTGTFIVLQATGIGGAGPFLEYHFPLFHLDLTSGSAKAVSPACLAYQVLSSGGVVCGLGSGGLSSFVGLDVRSASGQNQHLLINGPFSSLVVSQDERQLAVTVLGGTAADHEYQVKTAQLTSTVLSDFGPPGFLDEAWLPDGRLVADKTCLIADSSPTTCDPRTNGTRYILNADGSSPTLFYKLGQGARVVGVVS